MLTIEVSVECIGDCGWGIEKGDTVSWKLTAAQRQARLDELHGELTEAIAACNWKMVTIQGEPVFFCDQCYPKIDLSKLDELNAAKEAT